MPTTHVGEARGFISRINRAYEVVHKDFEDQFWGTKMNLEEGKGTYTSEKLSSTKQVLESFLESEENLIATKELLQKLSSERGAGDGEEVKEVSKTLKIFQRTFESYQMNATAKPLRESVTKLESDLEMKRNALVSGYTVPKTGEFVKVSSVALRQQIRNNADEAMRKAAYEGIRKIGPYICENGWLEIVKGRNKMAKILGYEDFYDYKVQQAEGFSKKLLFEKMLNDLEEKTRPLMEKAIETLKREKGDSAFQPWNMSYSLAGELVKKQDPFFPFETSVIRFAQCYANMNINYQGATLNLDLLDREKKYSNGFCHWPQPAWQCPERGWQPSTANFTSLAIPDSIGSGKTALTTLMHEAGHAAHFANVKQGSPFFSQERAPTSVAYAENQSMFLDSLVDDSDWRAKYALDREGKPIPFELIEEAIRATHVYDIFALRNMLVVPFFEKALYELPEEKLDDKEFILNLADEIETKICGGLMGRPVLSVPHIMSDESSCYYHGYVLAEMSVHQTRHYFLKKYGYLTDNPQIGPELTEAYWKCGNAEMFLDLVKNLTGEPLTSNSWVADLAETMEDKVKAERELYEAMTQNEDGRGRLEKNADVDKVLNMRLICSDGDKKLADSEQCGGSIVKAAADFQTYVEGKYFKK